MTTRSLTTGLALASLLLPGALAATLQVHHRLLHLYSDVELPQFEHRGAIDLSPPGSASSSSIVSTKFQPDSGSSAVIEEWINRWKKDPTYHHGDIFYQVALQRAEEDTPDMWDVQSVRLCHIPFSTSDTFVLHLSPSAKSVIDRGGEQDSKSFDDRNLVEWFSYYVHPVPRDGSCSPATLGPTSSNTNKRKVSQPPAPLLSNSTVEVRDVLYTPKVALRPSLPMTSTGEPIKPPPEKSFLQKYWMYIGAFMLILAVAAPPPESEDGPDNNGAGAGRKQK